MEQKPRQKIVVPHKVLLIEIERNCVKPNCKTKTRMSLTKNEADAYHGFRCNMCGTWNEDWLTPFDAPEWVK